MYDLFMLFLFRPDSRKFVLLDSTLTIIFIPLIYKEKIQIIIIFFFICNQ